ncbi:MAG: cytochrome c oxidase subunit 3 [Maioricimonas sp. JB049]
MSTTTAPSPEVAPPEHSGGGHDDHGHDPFLAHHFGSAKQQFDAGKFGMWLFLVTEVLFFSGLFCAYAVYRSSHPEAFANADQFLDPMLGAANTVVLIFSSLTMAWAVRAAQLGQKQLLVRLLTITISCASIFLGVKSVEYSHKWDLGILWSSQFNPQAHAVHSPALLVLAIPAMIGVVVTATLFGVGKSRKSELMSKFWGCLLVVTLAYFGGVGLGLIVPAVEGAITGNAAHATAEAGHHAAEHAAGQAASQAAGESMATTAAKSGAVEAAAAEQTAMDMTYTGVFFSIYYVMTGLHGIHILIGMGVMTWLLYRSLLGHFGPRYFGPVDFVGLYWHLVDLIWIYLFPLLYLIG